MRQITGLAFEPCPFCGGLEIHCHEHPGEYRRGDLHHQGQPIYSMACQTCGATFPNMYSPEKLVEKWNRRAAPDGWIPWAGGECPVHPDTWVILKTRSDWICPVRAGNAGWDHSDGPADVIAYRISNTHPTPIAQAVTAAEASALRERVDKAERRLATRDDFIVKMGDWPAFMQYLDVIDAKSFSTRALAPDSLRAAEGHGESGHDHPAAQAAKNPAQAGPDPVLGTAREAPGMDKGDKAGAQGRGTSE